MAEHCIVEISIYRAVLFDMDGVIADTMPLHYEAWRRAFEPLGITVDKMDVYLREGMATTKDGRKDRRSERQAIYRRNRWTGSSRIKVPYLTKLALEKAKAYDGVTETLRMLRNNGLKTALVTGSRRDAADAVLKKIGLKDAFDAIVCAEDVKHGKPGPEPYEAAIKKLGVDRLNCIVVENAPLGIESAKAAKVDYVIAVATTLPESYLSEADDIMSSISDLEQCLAQRFKARPGRARFKKIFYSLSGDMRPLMIIWSASTSEIMASTTGTARGTTDGSCLPLISMTASSFLRKLTVCCGRETDGVGLTASRQTMGMPVLMPPSMPPEWFVRVRTTSPSM